MTASLATALVNGSCMTEPEEALAALDEAPDWPGHPHTARNSDTS